ncbi:hypothetical protein Slin14017_G047530 [Septoria linicola]|nr:hypothetical protein Slin14017_G047530 [Septoria linicola]
MLEYSIDAGSAQKAQTGALDITTQVTCVGDRWLAVPFLESLIQERDVAWLQISSVPIALSTPIAYTLSANTLSQGCSISGAVPQASGTVNGISQSPVTTVIEVLPQGTPLFGVPAINSNVPAIASLIPAVTSTRPIYAGISPSRSAGASLGGPLTPGIQSLIPSKTGHVQASYPASSSAASTLPFPVPKVSGPVVPMQAPVINSFLPGVPLLPSNVPEIHRVLVNGGLESKNLLKLQSLIPTSMPANVVPLVAIGAPAASNNLSNTPLTLVVPSSSAALASSSPTANTSLLRAVSTSGVVPLSPGIVLPTTSTSKTAALTTAPVSQSTKTMSAPTTLPPSAMQLRHKP